jgi:hypothetical protein
MLAELSVVEQRYLAVREVLQGQDHRRGHPLRRRPKEVVT